MRILLDTCVIMDAIQNREPFAEAAKDISRKAAMNSFIGCITTKASTDIHYLTHRCTHSDKETRIILTKLFPFLMSLILLPVIVKKQFLPP